MGDKYETGREMLQQEINNLQIQLNENRSHENILKSLNSNPYKMSGLGSLVQTDAGFFYISVSAGEILHEKIKIFAVSADSPVAKEMAGIKVGEEFAVNGMKRVIRNIW